jgi:hypothetical protein
MEKWENILVFLNSEVETKRQNIWNEQTLNEKFLQL